MDRAKYYLTNLWGRFDRGLSYVSGGVARVSGWLVVAMVLVVVAAIFCRYILHISVIWSEEIPVMCNVLFVFLGTPYILRIGGHIRIDMVISSFSERRRSNILAASLIPVAIYSGIVAWEGVKMTMIVIDGHWVTESLLSTPMWIPYLAMTICMCMLFLESLAMGIRFFLKGREVP